MAHHPAVHPSTAAERWDLPTVFSTGAAAGFVGGALAFGLHGGPVLVVLVALATAVGIGLLAGYRPLHESDTGEAEA